MRTHARVLALGAVVALGLALLAASSPSNAADDTEKRRADVKPDALRTPPPTRPIDPVKPPGEENGTGEKPPGGAEDEPDDDQDNGAGGNG